MEFDKIENYDIERVKQALKEMYDEPHAAKKKIRYSGRRATKEQSRTSS